jgi:flagellar hook assembly protein FlgD
LVRTVNGGEFRSPIATVTMRSHALALMQNHPNPFNPQTTISYELPAGARRVRLFVFDLSGRVVRTLVDDDQPGGSYDVEWDGKNDSGEAIASGVYFYALNVGTQKMTRKLVLLK